MTPFLNAERFLAEAIESVLAQTFVDWELLLVDDGSSDAGAEIALARAASDPRRTAYMRHEDGRTHRLSASRSAGIARARGEYVAFLDTDDVWLGQPNLTVGPFESQGTKGRGCRSSRLRAGIR